MANQYDHAELIRSLRDPAAYRHAVDRVSVIETHISSVLLAGEYAYKIKKPVDLGFVDFSTLEKRLLFCNEEVRLNRRLAPSLYLGVVPVTGTLSRPLMDGAGPAIEYAVKMRRFPQECMADRLLAQDHIAPRRMDELAGIVAAFHRTLPKAGAETAYGSRAVIGTYVLQNFDHLAGAGATPSDARAIAAVRDRTLTELDQCQPLFEQRKTDGFVRECHGDLHLGNVALIDDRLVIFDCIEFNPELRWIDVMSEVAFMAMDLEDRGRPAYAARFLNRYLETTGDYEGISLLRFYLTYRAMVRAKVRWLRANQPRLDTAARLQAKEQSLAYLRLAERYAAERKAALLITHGLSGSGKTTFTQPVLEALGAVRIRSDLERKRLFHIEPTTRPGSGIAEGIYGTTAGDRTYARLSELAARILQAGWPVIVDATFLVKERRDRFRLLAQDNNAPFLMLDFEASEASLRDRLRGRSREGKDASDADIAVLEEQMRQQQPLTAEEKEFALTIDTEKVGAEEAARMVQKRCALD
jgi:aminoglycoside phosphotransferase family enzyme/gluconate kinase